MKELTKRSKSFARAKCDELVIVSARICLGSLAGNKPSELAIELQMAKCIRV